MSHPDTRPDGPAVTPNLEVPAVPTSDLPLTTFLVATPAGMRDYLAADADDARRVHALAFPDPATREVTRDHWPILAVPEPVAYYAHGEHGYDDLTWPLPADVWLRHATSDGSTLWSAQVAGFSVKDWWTDDDPEYDDPRETWCQPITSPPEGAVLTWLDADARVVRRAADGTTTIGAAPGEPFTTPAPREPVKPEPRELVTLHLATGQRFVIDATATMAEGLMPNPAQDGNADDDVPGLVSTVRAAAFDNAHAGGNYLLDVRGCPVFFTSAATIVAAIYNRRED